MMKKLVDSASIIVEQFISNHDRNFFMKKRLGDYAAKIRTEDISSNHKWYFWMIKHA